MATKIEKKIVGCSVAATPTSQKDADGGNEPSTEVVHLTEQMARPVELVGLTYKIKTPLSDHALYVTINDIVLNQDTSHERRRPFEIFINSKNMDHFQWIVALTRIISAVFRKGGDVAFLVEELRSVFDPRGGYFKKGVFMPSLVAEIGEVIETHLKAIGLIVEPELDPHQKALIEGKRAQYEASLGETPAGAARDGFPPNAEACPKCHAKAVVVLDGCRTCLSCADSKCS